MFDLFDCEALQVLPVPEVGGTAAAATAGGEDAEAVAMVELVTAPVEVVAATDRGCSTYAAAVLYVFGSLRSGMRRTLPRDPPTYAATAADVFQVHHTSSSSSSSSGAGSSSGVGSSTSISGGDGDDWAVALAEVLCLVEVLAPDDVSMELVRKVAVSLNSTSSTTSSSSSSSDMVVAAAAVAPYTEVIVALPAAAMATVGKGEELWGKLVMEIVNVVDALIKQQQQQQQPMEVAAAGDVAADNHGARAERAVLQAAASGETSGAGHAQRAQRAILAAAASGPPATTPYAKKAVAALCNAAATASVTPHHEKAAAAIAEAVASGGGGNPATAHVKKAVAALTKGLVSGGNAAATAMAESALLIAAANGGKTIGAGEKGFDQKFDQGFDQRGDQKSASCKNIGSTDVGYYSSYQSRVAVVAEAVATVQAAAVAVDGATAATSGALAAAGDTLMDVAAELDNKGGEVSAVLLKKVHAVQAPPKQYIGMRSAGAAGQLPQEDELQLAMLQMLPQLLLPRALYVAALAWLLPGGQDKSSTAGTSFAVQWEAAVAAVAEKQVPQGQLLPYLLELVQELQAQHMVKDFGVLGDKEEGLVRAYAEVLAAVALDKLQPLFSSREEAVAKLLYVMLTGAVAAGAPTAEAAAALSSVSSSSSSREGGKANDGTSSRALIGEAAAKVLLRIAEKQQQQQQGQVWLTATAATFMFDFHSQLLQSKGAAGSGYRGEAFFTAVAAGLCHLPLQPQLLLLLLLTPLEKNLPQGARQAAVAKAADGVLQNAAKVSTELAYLCNKCSIGGQWPLSWYAQLLSELLEQYRATATTTTTSSSSSSSSSSYCYVAPLWAVVNVLGPMRGMRVVHSVPGGVLTLLPLSDLAEVMCYCQELMPRAVAERLQRAVAGAVPGRQLEELLVMLPNAARAAFGKGELFGIET
jgi:hypothetical protein